MQDETKERAQLGQLADHFLSQLPPDDRQRAQLEVNRFVRWSGMNMPVSQLTGLDVARYVEGLSVQDADLNQRLESIRSFLTFLYRQGLTVSNLATSVRLRRATSASVAASSQAAAGQPTTLTLAGYQALQMELESLKQERPRIAAELRHAMADKDFRENSPLDAIRDQQARLEGRIRDLEAILSRAEIVETSERAGVVVQLGDTVVLRDSASGQVLRYTIVGPGEVDFRNGKISAESPVGKAVMGRTVGDEIEVVAPAGTRRFRIESVEEL